jgi:hypothetical protein
MAGAVRCPGGCLRTVAQEECEIATSDSPKGALQHSEASTEDDDDDDDTLLPILQWQQVVENLGFGRKFL